MDPPEYHIRSVVEADIKAPCMRKGCTKLGIWALKDQRTRSSQVILTFACTDDLPEWAHAALESYNRLPKTNG